MERRELKLTVEEEQSILEPMQEKNELMLMFKMMFEHEYIV